ncbi:MAG: hypothetical protein FD149_226 [Rhodospirillaceae bacterium]|nr:MAG: hypothetical protein FD149_226 [Rhodospirillaceae bacterium]
MGTLGKMLFAYGLTAIVSMGVAVLIKGMTAVLAKADQKKATGKGASS